MSATGFRFYTLEKFCELSGYKPDEVRTKIRRGDWQERSVWVKAPDGRILIDREGYERWATEPASPAHLVTSKVAPQPSHTVDTVSDADGTPFEQRWLSAREVAILLSYSQRYVTNTLKHVPGFPTPQRNGHPRWLAGELMEWQLANRAAQQDRRRRPRSRATKT